MYRFWLHGLHGHLCLKKPLNLTTLSRTSWWRHQMETFSALLAICAGNSPVPGEFPAQWPVALSFDIFFDLRLNKRLSKQSWGWWFETLSHPLWRHCNKVEPWSSFTHIYQRRVTGAEQSYDYPSSRKVTPRSMDKIDLCQTTTTYNTLRTPT